MTPTEAPIQAIRVALGSLQVAVIEGSIDTAEANLRLDRITKDLNAHERDAGYADAIVVASLLFDQLGRTEEGRRSFRALFDDSGDPKYGDLDLGLAMGAAERLSDTRIVARLSELAERAREREDPLGAAQTILEKIEAERVERASFPALLAKSAALLSDAKVDDLGRRMEWFRAGRTLLRQASEHGVLDVAERTAALLVARAEDLAKARLELAREGRVRGLRIDPSMNRWVMVAENMPTPTASPIQPPPDATAQTSAKAQPREDPFANVERQAALYDLRDASDAIFDVATFEQNLGRLDVAAARFARSMALDREVFGEGHPMLAVGLLSSGIVDLDRQRYDAATASITDAVTRLEGDGSEASLAYLSFAREAAMLVRAAAGDVTQALAEMADLQRGEVLPGGDSVPDQIRRRMNYGGILRTAGRTEDAWKAFDDALERSVAHFGEGHPQTASIRLHRTALASQQGDGARALAELELAVASGDRALDLVLSLGAESDKLAHLRKTWRERSAAMSIAIAGSTRNARTVELAYGVVLNRKGRVAEAVAHARLPHATGGSDEALLARRRDLALARTDLSELVLRGGNREVERRERLESEIRELEREISKQVAVEPRLVTIDDLRRTLDPKEALVDFVRYRPMNASARAQADRWQAPRYAAFTLFPDGRLLMFEIGDAAQIDAAIADMREALVHARPVDDAARRLSELVWHPLRAHLQDVERVHVSPDGALAAIPFEALRDVDDVDLLWRHTFVYQDTARALLRPTSPASPSNRSVLIANPDFGAGRVVQPGALHGTRFAPLPGTAIEGEVVARALGDVERLVEGRASKQALLAVKRPRVLHVATHGYFVGSTSHGGDDTRGLDFESPTRTGSSLPDNPLLRSGLAFADANRDTARGVLTALEASNLDLEGTRLVTLSACETGLGTLEDGEGVQGLRRALAIAGAETQVVSLWKVDDAATAKLMSAYYGDLASGEGRVDALRLAALELARDPATAHPYYWAAFVGSGSTRTLDGAKAPTRGAIANDGPRSSSARCAVARDVGAFDGMGGAFALALLALIRRRRRRDGTTHRETERGS